MPHPSLAEMPPEIIAQRQIMEDQLVERELSLIQVPVQNQNLHSGGPKYAQHLRHSAYQEKWLDIGFETFRSIVSISAVRECVTKTLQTSLGSRDALTCVKP